LPLGPSDMFHFRFFGSLESGNQTVHFGQKHNFNLPQNSQVQR
jgi:hypothetical protein